MVRAGLGVLTMGLMQIFLEGVLVMIVGIRMKEEDFHPRNIVHLPFLIMAEERVLSTDLVQVMTLGTLVKPSHTTGYQVQDEIIIKTTDLGVQVWKGMTHMGEVVVHLEWLNHMTQDMVRVQLEKEVPMMTGEKKPVHIVMMRMPGHRVMIATSHKKDV